MGTLRKFDVSVFPAWMCKGKPVRDQVVLTYLFMLAGEEWTYKQMTEMCGCGVTTALLDGMVKEGLLSETNPDTRKNSKPCNKYVVNADFVPDRPEEVAEKPKEKVKFPTWTWPCLNAWKASLGILSPMVIYTTLKPAVTEYGEQVVVKGFEEYCKRADKKWASPRNFVQRINSWIRTTHEQHTGPSLRDML